MKFLVAFLILFLVSCTSLPTLATNLSGSAVQLYMNDKPFCSGVVIAKNRVLTNDHCVRLGTTDGVVVFFDGSKKPYKTLKQGDMEKSPDLALIEVETDVAPVTFGEMPKQGSYAVAMGSPFGLGWSFTMGVISFVNRDLKDEVSEESYGIFIQHDALTNLGSSGSGLFNLSGELIGLNARGGSGISWAVPINQIIAFLKDS